MKLAFLYQPHPYEVDPASQLGLGLLALATYAGQLGHEVKVYNAQATTVEAACSMVEPCEVLCLYGCLLDAPVLNAVVSQLRVAGVVQRVVVGGPIALSPEVLEAELFDHIVQGEGEDFIKDYCSGVPFPKLVELPPLRHDVNFYPFPRRDLVPGKRGGRIFLGPNGFETGTLLTSRGCRYRCAFCGSNTMAPGVRNYSKDRIEAELEHLLGLGIKALRISDDNIINEPERLEWLSRLLGSNGVRWRGSIRVHPTSGELYRIMAENGCEELSFGIESGDQRVLRCVAKGTKVEQNTAAVQAARAAGIPVVRALMMMATPGETWETLERNKAWVLEALPSVVSLKTFVPYPGTKIARNPERYGCRIVDMSDVNYSAYRADGSDPISHVELPGVMSAAELTAQFRAFKAWLVEVGAAHFG